MDEVKVLMKAVECWGIEHQMRKLQEELAELIVATSHYLDHRGKGVDSFHEEFVDVQILLDQIKPHLNHKKLVSIRSSKLKRLEKRINLAHKPLPILTGLKNKKGKKK